MTIYGSTPWYALDGWIGNTTDNDGVEWIITAEDGWGSAAPTRAALQDREADDGAIDAPTYASARIITLTGTAVAPTWALQNAAKDRLNAVANTSRGLYPLVVTERHLERMCLVRRSGVAKLTDVGPYAFEFSLTLVAPAPAKLAATPTVDLVSLAGIAGGGAGRFYPRIYPKVYGSGDSGIPIVTANNVGNAATSAATFVIAGGIHQPGVMNTATGEFLQFDFTELASDVFTIDLERRTAILNGTASRRSRLMLGSSWFRIPPGLSELRLLGTTTGSTEAVMTVTYQSAWK